ncbi:uncharacterized protein HMPREF1541_04913 [Cyphellophora europaea CBS 101466]|uniref:BHLH domain-containing protein n=1 Tax=Cyphellophora europaea (strain CBS 101466) TaxID=1220924 RepID=W2RY77_CYPE1|nr:uncharacterized protein HMPREF1541_04913 [Cyphellophora europaea CBS 101466]ETN40634.1 hypothetical protein HMPREF1541_04913 [Cyphellophora europaea CBS 101466]
MAQPSNKRKRGNDDLGRNVKENKSTNPEEDFSASLLQIASDDNQRTAQQALSHQEVLAQSVSYPDPAFDASGLDAFGNTSPSQALSTPQNHNLYTGVGQTSNTGDGVKPSVGTPEWHQARKDSHKEVERRRREVINEGIEHLAKIVPGPDKNKGAILQRTHNWITDMQEKERKWENERQITQLALDELTKRNETLRNSNRQAWNESNKWQQRCRDLGGEFDDYDSHGPQFDDANDLDSSLPTS